MVRRGGLELEPPSFTLGVAGLQPAAVAAGATHAQLGGEGGI